MAAHEPFVSVIIPAYNEEQYIRRTLQCIAGQTFTDYEIIVADNNSTDKTVEIAKEFGATVVHVRKQGAVFAYDEGMRHGQGKILVNVDADSEPPPHWLETVVRLLKPADVVAVTGTATVRTGSKVLDELGKYGYSFFIGSNFLIGKPHLSGFNFGVKRSAFLKVGGMNTNYRMSFEVDLGLRLSKIGKVVFAKDLCVITSTRRWGGNTIKALGEYAKGYIYTIWLRKPPPFKQTVIR